MSEMLDSAQKMAQRAVALKFEDLTRKEVDFAKQSIMDCLGVMIAGATLGGKSADIVDMMLEQGGKEEATIFPRSTALSRQSAVKPRIPSTVFSSIVLSVSAAVRIK